MKCDTCHREVPEVSRVVIYTGYNRLTARAVYNCPDCFAKKEASKPYSRSQTRAERETKESSGADRHCEAAR